MDVGMMGKQLKSTTPGIFSILNIQHKYCIFFLEMEHKYCIRK
jgi:hypothetical protein